MIGEEESHICVQVCILEARESTVNDYFAFVWGKRIVMTLPQEIVRVEDQTEVKYVQKKRNELGLADPQWVINSDVMNCCRIRMKGFNTNKNSSIIKKEIIFNILYVDEIYSNAYWINRMLKMCSYSHVTI